MTHRILAGCDVTGALSEQDETSFPALLRGDPVPKIASLLRRSAHVTLVGSRFRPYDLCCLPFERPRRTLGDSIRKFARSQAYINTTLLRWLLPNVIGCAQSAAVSTWKHVLKNRLYTRPQQYLSV